MQDRTMDQITEPNVQAARDAFNKLRNEQGITYDELARRTGIGRSTILDLAQGRSAGLAKTWYALATVLGVNVGDLLNHFHDPTE